MRLCQFGQAGSATHDTVWEVEITLTYLVRIRLCIGCVRDTAKHRHDTRSRFRRPDFYYGWRCRWPIPAAAIRTSLNTSRFTLGMPTVSHTLTIHDWFWRLPWQSLITKASQVFTLTDVFFNTNECKPVLFHPIPSRNSFLTKWTPT